MQRVLAFICAVGLATIGSSAPVRADFNTSPGKSAAYAAASSVALTASSAPVLAAQIEKGKKKRVLEVAITAVVNGTTTAGNVVAVYPRVNGLTIFEPSPGFNPQLMHACSATYVNCTTTSRFWLDLDTAEAANPGVFISQPLNIEAMALVGTGTLNASISIEAKLVKK